MSSFTYHTEYPTREQRINNLKFMRQILRQAKVEALAKLDDAQDKLAKISQQLKELGYEETD